MEELLELTRDERDEDEEERAARWDAGETPAAPAPATVEEGTAGPESPPRAGTEALPAELKTADRPPAALAPAEAGEPSPGAGGEGAGEDSREPAPDVFWPDRPVVPAAAPNGAAAPEAEATGWAALTAAVQTDPEKEADAGAARALESARRGLEALYQKTAGAVQTALPPLGGGQAGRAVRAAGPEAPRQLTVDELDRAVRRDSWRYDGGMTLF